MRKPLVIILTGLLLITLSTTFTTAKNNIHFINNPNVKPVQTSVKLHMVGKFGDHNILITQNNKVYVWGYNRRGQLGLGYATTSSPYGILTPTENSQLEQIIQENGGTENILTLETGSHHNILVFKNGKVYVWGYNGGGQLGLGYASRSSPYGILTPTENTQLEQIIQNNGGVDNILTLGTGWNHNILIFKNGKVYVWGSNDRGQLGIGDTNNRYTPTENTQLEQIIQDNGGVESILTLETSAIYNILVFKNGKVYVWGDNENYQLGVGDRWKRKTPTENSKLEQIIQQNGGVDNILTLKTGTYHNIIVFKNGKVYVWGSNCHGQLGHEDWWVRNVPTENSLLERIIHKNGGTDNILTLETGWGHNILIFKNGKVYVWGLNNYGQLGLRGRVEIKTPTENTHLEQLIQQNGGVFLGGGSSDVSSIVVLL